MREAEAGPALREAVRAAESTMIYMRIGKLMNIMLHHHRPQTPMGKAFVYGIGNWERFGAYLTVGVSPMANRIPSGNAPRVNQCRAPMSDPVFSRFIFVKLSLTIAKLPDPMRSTHHPTPQSGTALLAAMFIGALPHFAGAAPVSDSYALQPGWNAVFIEVEPSDSSPAAVFNHPAVKQVWTRNDSGSPVQFISDPSEAQWNKAEGRRYVPAGRPESVVTDLFAILGNRAYLVEIEGAAPVNLTITGEPSRRAFNWVGQSYNLSGLSVDPSSPVSLGDYFAPSAGHAGQKILQLNSAGRWVQVPPATLAVPGRAYWIYAAVGSNYRAPLAIEPQYEQGFFFVDEIAQADLTLTNPTAAPMQVSLENVDSLPLVHALYDATSGTLWPDLATHTLTLAAGESRVVTVGIRKPLLTDETGGTVLVTGGGSRYRIPVVLGGEVSAVIGNSAASAVPAFTGVEGPEEESGSAHVGLWLGQALVSKVAYVNDATPANRVQPVETASAFPLKILLHFDAAGNATLLGQVTILKKGAGDDEEFVLISDDALIPSYSGASLVDGEEFGYRLTALAFDTVASAGIAMTGDLATGLTATITIPRSDPVHPYKHKFHPDHDGLDAQYQPQAADLSPILTEVWDISRTITLTVAPATLDQTQPPGAGDSILTGTYAEQVTGMHRETLHSSGELSLQRLVRIPQLNPQP